MLMPEPRYSLNQFWQMKALARSSFQVSQDYFPETMGQLAIVNAPSSFTFIWGIMKPWLSKETVAKIDILGTDYQEQLLRLVDKESLPASLGGECRCEGGCEYSFAGPWKEGLEERRTRRAREKEEVEGATNLANASRSASTTEGTVNDSKTSLDRPALDKVGEADGVQAKASVAAV